MSIDVWKEYEENPLTHSAAHYLMTIHELLDENGYARVTDIAKRMSITRGSCSIGLKALKRRGLVVQDDNRFLQLSAKGQAMAELVERNDQLLEQFFRDVLGVEKEQAEIDACKIEHLISIDTSMRLAAFLQLFDKGSPSAQGIVNEMNELEPSCSHDSETCSFCQNLCFLEIQPET